MKRLANLPTTKCTGCGACYNICPTKAIVMVPNSEGFKYPEVDESKCTNCGLCEKTCPIINSSFKNTKKPQCLAVWAEDKIRLKSSSGGVFSLAAEYILDSGGYVCGAVYDENFMVHHIVTSKKEDLEKIRGSKYIQSDTKKVFAEIKQLLKQDKTILFSGCPCQVAGLYAFLGGDHKNLITMDIVCHGIPSPKVFQKYLNEKFPGKEIVNIDFRDKEVYGWSSNIKIELSDGHVYRDKHDSDLFYKAFLSCLALRESCKTCPFSAIPRQGDITIGDFWGISRYNPEWNDKKGTSVVLINNKKGKQLLNKMKHRMPLVEKVPIKYAIQANKAIIQPFRAHPARKRFFDELNNRPLSQHVDDCLNHRYDVGIVGLWYGLNYGSILTAYALYQVVESLGYSVLMINKPKSLWTNRYEDRGNVSGQFIYKRCNVSNVRKSYNEWRQLNNHCDTFIVGSDVVWNYNVCGSCGHFFFLDFVNDNKKKIAYASSFGEGYFAPDDVARLTKYYINKFDYISVRETEAVDICREKFNVNSTEVLDPVFICDREMYNELINDSKANELEKFIFSYILGPNSIKRNLLLFMSELLNIPLKNVVDLNAPERCESILQLPVIKSPRVEDWLYYIKNCDFFIGDSFHGLCFSIIFEKQFIIVIDRNMPSKCRFISLLTKLNLLDRLIYLDEINDGMEKIRILTNKKIDYNEVNLVLNAEVEKSKQWLVNSLNSPKVYNKTAVDILLNKVIDDVIDLKRRVDFLEKNNSI